MKLLIMQGSPSVFYFLYVGYPDHNIFDNVNLYSSTRVRRFTPKAKHHLRTGHEGPEGE
jgi:hypothetical protein